VTESNRLKTMAINKVDGGLDLASRIRLGDRQSETELVERYKRVVMSIIRREVGVSAVAEDLYQETFCIVIEKIRQGDIREADRLSGFVCSVARNRVIKYFQRLPRHESLTDTTEAAHLPHHASNPLEQLLRKENADIVRQVLKEMPNERDIQLLFRYYLAEDDKEKICADLGLTALHFNRVLHRARARYRELYEQAIRGK